MATPADPLQGFGQVLTGERPDVLGGNGVQEVVGVLLPVERLAQADRYTDDHHLLDRPGPVDARLAGGRIGAAQHRCDTRC